MFQLQELCVQYWASPGDRRGKKYAEFSVHTIEQDQNTGYTVQRLGVTDSRVSGEGGKQEGESSFWSRHSGVNVSSPHVQTGQEHQVVQFQIPVWAADGTCMAPLILVDTIHQIAVAQRKSGNKPIVVHGR